MPVEVKGVKATIKAIRKVDPDLLKEMNKQIRAVMIPIRDKARGYAPSPQPDNLYNWSKSADGGTGRFPLYDYSTVQKGIYYSQPAGERNKNGWRALYYVANKSAAGAIYETAGRTNPGGSAASKSNNPGAGGHFVSRMGPLYGSKREERGRMIFRAWAEDQGKAQAAVIKAIENTVKAFNQGSYTKAA